MDIFKSNYEGCSNEVKALKIRGMGVVNQTLLM
jgi:hypothetical protein